MLFFTPIGIKRNRWNETNRCRGHEKRSWTQELEEDHIHISPDRQQSKRNGPYDLITSFSETRILNIIHHACFRYSNFLQDKMLTGWWILMIIWWPHYNCELTRMLWKWLMIPSILTFDIRIIFHTTCIYSYHFFLRWNLNYYIANI